MANPQTPHRHLLFEPAAGGGVNVYALVFVERIPDGDPRCPAIRELSAFGTLTHQGRLSQSPGLGSAVPAAMQGVGASGGGGRQISTRSGRRGTSRERSFGGSIGGGGVAPRPIDAASLLSGMVEAAQSEWQGEGADLVPPSDIGAPGIRNTDPRVFAIGFQRETDEYGRAWTRKASQKIGEEMFTFDRYGKPLNPPLTIRGVISPSYGFTEKDLEERWIYRVVGKDRNPSQFNLDESFVEIPLFDKDAKFTGVWLYMADRIAPKKYAGIPSVIEFLHQSGARDASVGG